MISMALYAVGAILAFLTNGGGFTNGGGPIIYLDLMVIVFALSFALSGFALITRSRERAAVRDLPAPGYLDVVLFDEKNQ
jgi:hypothetical protein